MNKNRKAILLGIITITMWASSFTAIRVGLIGGYSSGHLVLARLLTASAIFGIYALWPGTQFKLPKKDDLIKIIILGFIGISIYNLGITFGEQTVSAGTASMIIGAAPIFTSLIAVLVLKERLSYFGWGGLFVGFIGIIIITLGTTGSTFTISGGALMILTACIATSIYFVFQKPFLKDYKAIEWIAYITWFGALPFLVFLPGLLGTIKGATLQASLATIYLGIFPSAIGYVTWAMAFSLAEASYVSRIMYAQPVIAIIIAWLWLGELPSLLSGIGGFIAISSIIIVNWLETRESTG